MVYTSGKRRYDGARKASGKRFNFSKSALAELIDDNQGKRVVVHDDKQTGLVADLREGGGLSFYLYRWANGRPHRIRIGAFPAVSIEQAREQARLLLADITKGIDPAAIKREKREEMSLAELFTHWLDTHAKPHKKTWREDQAMFDRYLASWKNRRLSTIRRTDVQALHVRVGETSGIYAANRLRGLLHSLFASAENLGVVVINPVRGIKKFREKSRERFLQADEFPRFWAALEAEPATVSRDCFKVCLFTGARRGNVMSMRWEQVHLDRATWEIPDTKSGEALTVALSPEAVAVLRDRLAAREKDCPWVFPGHVGGTHLKDPTKPWKAILKRAGLDNLRVHDLRRTMGSWQAATGASLPVIGKSLGHKLPQTTAIYARLNLDSVRDSVNRATEAMMAAAQVKPKRTKKGKAK